MVVVIRRTPGLRRLAALEPAMHRRVQHLFQQRGDLVRAGDVAVLASLFDGLADIRHHVDVEAVRDLEDAFPVDIIRGEHRRAVTRAPAFVMPQVEVVPFDGFVEFHLVAQTVLQHRRDQLLRRDQELLIEGDDKGVELLEMRVDDIAAVARAAHPLHVLAALQPGLDLLALLDRLGVDLRGDRRAQVPGDAVADVVGHGKILGARHVAGGAGRRGVIVLADDPFVGVQVHLVLVRAEGDAVRGFLVDLFLRMVRTQMAAATGVRLARLRGGEVVAQVAGGAGALGTIRIDAADAGVRPARLVQRAVRVHAHDGAMTGAATHRGDRRGAGQRRRAFDDLGEHVVERAEDVAGGGMMAAVELLDLFLVTLRTVLRRNDHRDDEILVHDRVFVVPVRLVAFIAADVRAEMLGMSPLVVDARGFLAVTGHAGGALATQLVETGENLDRLVVAHRDRRLGRCLLRHRGGGGSGGGRLCRRRRWSAGHRWLRGVSGGEL